MTADHPRRTASEHATVKKTEFIRALGGSLRKKRARWAYDRAVSEVRQEKIVKTRLRLVCLLATFTLSAFSIAQVSHHSVNRDALIGEVSTHVKILAFNTDKPVHYLRLVIDGKEVASDSFNATSNGVKLAVVTPPSGKMEVEVYYEVCNMGGYMKGGFRPLQEDNVGQSEYFGPGKNVVLNGWTQIYGYSQHYMGNPKALYDLRFEIR